ncbi:MAG: hypothetical protein JWQ71_690 [Pedosphaera sp.]|nr:hypothetical protein [Pedosphaera sp.]
MNAIKIVICILLLNSITGCKKAELPTQSEAPHHEHKAPHKGTPVELGEEEYHLELLLEPATGVLRAYVLDGEMENFVRLKEEKFELVVNDATGGVQLTFKGVPNSATGERLGDTSLFEAQSDWLKVHTNFEGKLMEIVIKGKRYSQVAFSFPKGNDHDGNTKQ